MNSSIYFLLLLILLTRASPADEKRPRPSSRPPTVQVTDTTKDVNATEPSVSTGKGQMGQIVNNMYSHCNSKDLHKGCFAEKKDCYENPALRNCEFLVNYERPKEMSKAWYRISFFTLGNASVMAMGLSKDRELGEDLFVECNTKLQAVQMTYFISRTERKLLPIKCGTQMDSRLAECQVRSGGSKNGFLFCSFLWRAANVVNMILFNTETTSFYLHTIRGADLNDESLEKKNYKKFTSQSKIAFYDVTQKKTQTVWIKLHGVLTIIVFLFCVPNSIFCARYLKETRTKPRSIFFNANLWFFAHTSLMLLGFVFLLLSLIFILTYTYKIGMQWPSTEDGKLHAILGTIAFVQYTVLVVFGWIRPTQDDNKRIVGILHFLTGISTYCIGLRNIIESRYLPNAKVPCSITFMTIAWVIWTLFWNLIMGFHFLWLGRLINISTLRAFLPLPVRIIVPFDVPGGKKRIQIFLWHLIGTGIGAFLISIVYIATKHDCRDAMRQD